MRTASLLAKGVAGRADALSARAVLQLATLNGARALGLEEHIGSIQPGKWADLTCVDLGAINTQPVYDPVSQLVYAASRDQVTDVWVAGKHVVSGSRLTCLDTAQLLADVREWHGQLATYAEAGAPREP
jgi:5-methylthioadenosine/S-adenosylhomocysteine deaminase